MNKDSVIGGVDSALRDLHLAMRCTEWYGDSDERKVLREYLESAISNLRQTRFLADK